MNLLTKIAIILIALAGAYGAGRYMTPAKIETKETVKTNTEYIIRETIKADGTVIKEQIKKDKVSKTNETKKEASKPNYIVGATGRFDFNTKEVVPGIMVQKRLLMNVFGGLTADKQSVGAVISMEF